MGCNESKHDIVTGNTVKTPPPPARKNSNNISVKKSKDLEVIPEITDDVNITAATTNPSSSLSSPSPSSLKSNDNKTELAVATDNNPVVTSKGINTVNAEHGRRQELKEDGPVEKSSGDDSLNEALTKEEDNIVNERHQRRLSGSSDHYFSSRKDEAAIKAIISAAAAADNHDVEKEEVVEEFLDQDDDDQSSKFVSNHENQEEKIETGLKDEETKEKDADDKNVVKSGDGGDLNNVKSSKACLQEQESSEEPEVVTTITPTVDQEKENPIAPTKNSTTANETT